MKMQALIVGLMVALGAPPAFAVSPGQRNAILSSGSPGWALHGNAVAASPDFIFSQGLYHQQYKPQTLNPNDFVTTVRATPPLAYAPDLQGNYYGFAPAIARVTNAGNTIEEARTNDALWARDMTNAAWIKVNMTAALTATGIDNTPNAASTLTATAGNATALQTVTLGSTADTYSVFLKRVSGSGTINITENGGTLWTPVVLTTSWQRFQVTATLANPVIGIQIVTSGDVIAADFNQLEPGGFALSPILTTNAAVTRAADVVTVTNPPVFGSAYTLFAKGTPQAPVAYVINQSLLDVSDGTTNNRVILQRNSTTGKMFTNNIVSGSSISSLTSIAVINPGSTAMAASSIAVGAQAMSLNGAAVVTASGASIPTGLSKINIGSRADGLVLWDGYISEIAIFVNSAQPAAQLQAFGSR